MFSRPQIRLFVLLALCLALTNASLLDAIAENFGKRAQPTDNNFAVSSVIGGLTSAVGGGVSLGLGSGSSSASISPSTSASVKNQQSSSTSTSASSTPTTSSTRESSTSSAPQTSPTSTPTPGTSASLTQQSETTQTTEAPTSSQSIAVITVVKTTDGSIYTSFSSSTQTSASSSSSSTSAASLTQNQSQSSGMSTKTKNTVIGVVVGVAGAIILAGLFVVAWRIWGRRKNEDESDGLMGFRGGSSGHEKTGSASATGPANPFQSTLENYHNPAKVNASSNF